MARDNRGLVCGDVVQNLDILCVVLLCNGRQQRTLFDNLSPTNQHTYIVNRIPIYISPVKPNKKTCQCYLWGVWLHQCQSINYEDYRYNHQSHHHSKTQQSTNRIHDSWKLLMSIALSLSLLLNWYHWREWPYIYTVFHLYQFWLHLIQVVHMTLQKDSLWQPVTHKSAHLYCSYM